MLLSHSILGSPVMDAVLTSNNATNVNVTSSSTHNDSSSGSSTAAKVSSRSINALSLAAKRNQADQVPEFNPDKITLAIPDALFSPSFSLANGISQVLGTLIQNKANRIARMFEALKPFLRSSVGIHSKNRPSRNELSDDFDDHKNADKRRFSNTNDLNDDSSDDTPIKTSYSALTG